MHADVAVLVDHYGLTPLPVEGTLFASTYRSAAELPDGSPVGTAMIGLYAHDPLSRSLFHRLPSDEVWLGSDIAAGQQVQHTVPAGVWQAGELHPDGLWGLFGCTMAPGFTGAGFEGARRAGLERWHGDRAVDIDRLCVPDDDSSVMPDGFAT